MHRTNRNWLPAYCNPLSFLPKVPETRTLFSRRLFLFQDFVSRAVGFLKSEDARKMGFELDAARVLPCKWKCSDESVFGIDLILHAQTGHYPFDKGRIGGYFNDSALAAAVHHGPIHIDFGGSHVGYVPNDDGGTFGHIWRPQQREYATDCGYLVGLVEPFLSEYNDACDNILVYRPEGGRVVLSVPNEFIQPNWSSRRIKLLIDTETLTAGEVPYQDDVPHTHTPIARTLFFAAEGFLDRFTEEIARVLATPQPTPIGRHLTPIDFNIYDAEATLGKDGLPEERLLLYMKYIVAAKHSPSALKVAIINTTIEYNRLIDSGRDARFAPFAFASFAGVFIDLYDELRRAYINLFQPLGLAIKPRGRTREIELTPEEIHFRFERIEPAAPQIPFAHVLGYDAAESVVEAFTYAPGRFREQL